MYVRDSYEKYERTARGKEGKDRYARDSATVLVVLRAGREINESIAARKSRCLTIDETDGDKKPTPVARKVICIAGLNNEIPRLSQNRRT